METGIDHYSFFVLLLVVVARGEAPAGNLDLIAAAQPSPAPTPSTIADPPLLSPKTFTSPAFWWPAWAKAMNAMPRPLLPIGGHPRGFAYKACRGWSPESRGYPCALWTSFHVLLAHAADPAKVRDRISPRTFSGLLRCVISL